MIVATHDLAFAARLCDRLVLLRDGCVVTAGAPDQVLTPPTIEAAAKGQSERAAELDDRERRLDDKLKRAITDVEEEKNTD